MYWARSSYGDDEESFTGLYEKLETEVTNEQEKASRILWLVYVPSKTKSPTPRYPPLNSKPRPLSFRSVRVSLV